jgi:uncharacterized protein YxjI
MVPVLLVEAGAALPTGDEAARASFKVHIVPKQERVALVIKDATGQAHCIVLARTTRLRRTMMIIRNSEQIAEVYRALLTTLWTRYHIHIVGEDEDLVARGDVLGHEYQICRRHHTIAKVSKQRCDLDGLYSVQIEPDYEDALILAIAVCIDVMVREYEDRGGRES